MSVETVVIVVVGMATTVFLLSCSWWLWRHASPVPLDVKPGPPPGPRLPHQELQPSVQAVPVEPMDVHAGATIVEPRKNVPLEPMEAPSAAGIDKARTMFFVKKPVAEKTEILTGAGPDEDAPASRMDLDQLRTSPSRRAKPRTERGLPPPPPPR